MATSVDRDRVIELLRGEFVAIAALCSDLSDDQWDLPTCLPGWPVRDVMAHLIGTESMLCGIPTPIVDISRHDHVRNPIAEVNEAWVESMRSQGTAELLARFEDVTGRRMAALQAMSQADFDAPSWTPAGKDETYGRFMRIRHYDCYLHEHDIRYAVGAPSRAAAADVRSSLEEVATGLGYLVGRKAAVPDGSTVRIELTGDVPVTFLIAVDGRAILVDSLDGPPTVGISLPAMVFLRLTGGRADRQIVPEDEIDISGDKELGEHLVANLAFTI